MKTFRMEIAASCSAVYQISMRNSRKPTTTFLRKSCYLNRFLSQIFFFFTPNRTTEKIKKDDEHVPREETTEHKRQKNLLTIKLKRGLSEIK